jgi:TFIIF-interacting CTD phosphatase-like protein
VNLPPRKAEFYSSRFSNKTKTIVFDIDETLLHAKNKPSDLPGGLYDDITKVIINEGEVNLYISYRPYLKEMLRSLS